MNTEVKNFINTKVKKLGSWGSWSWFQNPRIWVWSPAILGLGISGPGVFGPRVQGLGSLVLGSWAFLVWSWGPGSCVMGSWVLDPWSQSNGSCFLLLGYTCKYPLWIEVAHIQLNTSFLKKGARSLLEKRY